MAHVLMSCLIIFFGQQGEWTAFAKEKVNLEQGCKKCKKPKAIFVEIFVR